MGSRRQGRILAIQTLYGWEISGGSVEEHLELVLSEATQLSEESSVFARLIACGVIEKIAEVDEAITGRLEHWEIGRLAKVDLAILRVAAYEMLFQQTVPAKVCIDEAIEIAKEFGADESFRFVNGVLDSLRGHIDR